jgi:3-hydroxyacyl-CoA dehydrogenase
MDARLARIHPVSDYDAIADADVVIEAIFEEMGAEEGGLRQARRGDEAGRADAAQHLGARTSTRSPR